MHLDTPYRVEYEDSTGHHWTELFSTYQGASIQAALLHEKGAKILAIFRDAGSNPTDGVGSQYFPPRWLRRLGFG